MSVLGNLLSGGRKLHDGNPFVHLVEELKLLLSMHYLPIAVPGRHPDGVEIFFIPTFPDAMPAADAFDRIEGAMRDYVRDLIRRGPKKQYHGGLFWEIQHGDRSIEFTFQPRLQDMPQVLRSNTEYNRQTQIHRARKQIGMELRNQDIFAYIVQNGDSAAVLKDLGMRYGISHNTVRAIWHRALGDWSRTQRAMHKPCIVLNRTAGTKLERYRIYTEDSKYCERAFGPHRNDVDYTIVDAMQIVKHWKS